MRTAVKKVKEREIFVARKYHIPSAIWKTLALETNISRKKGICHLIPYSVYEVNGN